MTPPEIPPCSEMVELLTAYLDGALTAESAAAFEDHLRGCPGCQAALGQWRTVIELSSRLTPEDVAALDPYVRHRFATAVAKVRRR